MEIGEANGAIPRQSVLNPILAVDPRPKLKTANLTGNLGGSTQVAASTALYYISLLSGFGNMMIKTEIQLKITENI